MPFLSYSRQHLRIANELSSPPSSPSLQDLNIPMTKLLQKKYVKAHLKCPVHEVYIYMTRISRNTWKNADSTVVVFTLILRLVFVCLFRQMSKIAVTVNKRENKNTENFELRNVTSHKNV